MLSRLLNDYTKLFGIIGLLLVVIGVTAMMDANFLKPTNLENTVRWTAYFGIIGIGVAFVIMTGGIDLSIGSLIGLTGVILAMSMKADYAPQDPLTVTRVVAEERMVTVDREAAVYRTGDRVLFVENPYTIKSVDDTRITFEEEIASGGATGTLQRIHSLADANASEVSQLAIRRGANQVFLQPIIIDGDLSQFGTEDRLVMRYAVGLPKEYPVYDVTVADNVSTIRVLTRQRKIRLPAAVELRKRSQVMPTPLAILFVLAVALAIGLLHGVLITKVKLQPFVVTLCGLLIYRGLARFIASDGEQGFQSEYPDLKEFSKGGTFDLLGGFELGFDLPIPFLYMIILGIVASIFLNKTIYGRYILALGRNEEAARYSGINTDRMVIVSYMICSLCAGIAGILFALYLNSIQPSSHGEFYELYAIAAAVLGGCSLRGGEGSILGVVIAAAVMRVLINAINLSDQLSGSMEFAIIGLVILLGVIADELVKRIAARRRTAQQARQAES